MNAEQVRQALLGGAVPFVSALAILLAAWTPWRRLQRDRHRAWAAPVSLGFAAALSHVLLNGWVNEKWESILYAALLGVVWGIGLGAAGGRSSWVLLLCALATGWGTLAAMGDVFQESDPLIFPIAAGIAPVLAVLVMEPLAARRRGVIAPLAWGIGAGAMTIISVLSGNLTFGLLALALGGASAASALVGRWNNGFSFSGGAPVAGVVLGCLPVLCLLYVPDLPPAFPWAFALAFVSPWGAWLGEAGTNRARWPRLATGISVAIPTMLASTGVALAAWSSDVDVYAG